MLRSRAQVTCSGHVTTRLLDVGAVDEGRIDGGGQVGRRDHERILVTAELVELREECVDDRRVGWEELQLCARLVVGEYTAATSYYFLLLPVAPSVSCSWLDALNTPSSKLPLSPSVSYCLPMSTTRLSLLPNPHP